MSLLYTDSMLAMDVNTGKLAWYHQFIPGESFDIDEHYEFINVDIPGYAQVGFEMGKAGGSGISIVRRDSSFGGGHRPAEHDDHRPGGFDYKLEVINAPMGKPLYLPEHVRRQTHGRWPTTCRPMRSTFCRSMQHAYLAAENGQMGGECCRINMFQPNQGPGGTAARVGRFRQTLWTSAGRAALKSCHDHGRRTGICGRPDRYFYAFDSRPAKSLEVAADAYECQAVRSHR
jgi:hypothetical protein